MWRCARKWLVYAVVLWSPGLYALSTDKDQPIHIEADSAELDDLHGTAVYRGNVHYTQGSMELNADVATLYSTDRSHIDKVVAVGRPATFKQRPDNKDQDMRGHAKRIVYYADESFITLDDDAYLWQEGDEFTGDHIDYNTDTELVKARRASTGSRRIRVIIQPQQATPPAKAAPPVSSVAPGHQP